MPDENVYDYVDIPGHRPWPDIVTLCFWYVARSHSNVMLDMIQHIIQVSLVLVSERNVSRLTFAVLSTYRYTEFCIFLSKFHKCAKNLYGYINISFKMSVTSKIL